MIPQSPEVEGNEIGEGDPFRSHVSNMLVFPIYKPYLDNQEKKASFPDSAQRIVTSAEAEHNFAASDQLPQKASLLLSVMCFQPIPERHRSNIDECIEVRVNKVISSLLGSNELLYLVDLDPFLVIRRMF